MLVFIVEDDKWYAELLENQLQLHPEIKVKKFTTGEELMKHIENKPDVISLDYHLPDTNADIILDKVLDQSPQTEVIVISAQDDISTAINLVKRGTYNYIVKNKTARDQFRKDIIAIHEKLKTKNEINKIQEQHLDPEAWNRLLLGKSKKALELMRETCAVIERTVNYCIHGEEGLGIDRLVTFVHDNQQLRLQKKSQIKIFNVKMFNNESELINAVLSSQESPLNISTFQGTVFIKNIDCSSHSFQLQLKEKLFALNHTKKAFRIVLHTQKSLNELLLEEQIDTSFYYDYCGSSLRVPPLRERLEDIIHISQQIIYDYCEKNNLTLVKLSRTAEKKLMSYYFPGNIDELENTIKAAVNRSNKYEIEEEDIVFQEDNAQTFDFLLKEMTLKQYKQSIVQHFLDKYNYDVLLVADKLKVGKSTVYRMIKNGDVTLKKNKN